MSLGPLMVDLSGTELNAEDRDLLRHPLVGGVILFSRNYVSPEQLLALTADIHGLREPHPLVAVDQEGGRVQRFREGFTRLPSPAVFGRLYEHDPRRAHHLAETGGWLMAAELRAVGVDFSFAPVLDLDRGLNQVIGDRAFHRQPDVVADLGRAYLAGMHRAGMAGVGKHFPGHGGVSADSHVAVPVDERRFADIYMEDILPFERLIDEGLAGIMPAHVVYARLAPEPAGFSQFWLRQVLRDRLGFQGAIFSDDLAMEGASVAGDLPDRALAAWEAGCDMVLVCHRREAVAGIIDALSRWNDPAAQVRLARMHGRLATPRDVLLGSREWHEAVRDLAAAEDQTSLDLDFGDG